VEGAPSPDDRRHSTFVRRVCSSRDRSGPRGRRRLDESGHFKDRPCVPRFEFALTSTADRAKLN
jgi:hypothetical protein